MHSHFPKWKYAVLFVVLVVSIFYALPNMYGENPSVQISALNGGTVSGETIDEIKDHLHKQD